MSTLNWFGWLLLLFVRGLVIWFLIPIALVAWLLIHSWRQKASLLQAISWYDRNLVTILINGPLRFFIRADPRPSLARFSEMAHVKPHDIFLLNAV